MVLCDSYILGPNKNAPGILWIRDWMHILGSHIFLHDHKCMHSTYTSLYKYKSMQVKRTTFNPPILVINVASHCQLKDMRYGQLYLYGTEMTQIKTEFSKETKYYIYIIYRWTSLWWTSLCRLLSVDLSRINILHSCFKGPIKCWEPKNFDGKIFLKLYKISKTNVFEVDY